jgi:NAD(P)-dependent dehydrogenase (short-subunit alcohol dehydrogenase family)
LQPAYIETARLHEIASSMRRFDKRAPQIPLGRLGTEEDCAKVAVDFLCTGLSDYEQPDHQHLRRMIKF